jgi:type I site-specific restriction-modification system R (restriction) subunit
VTLKGSYGSGGERRQDLVLYVNGIAIGVLELKNRGGRQRILMDGVRRGGGLEGLKYREFWMLLDGAGC